MSIAQAELTSLLRNERFPRSGNYDPLWVVENLMGPNSLWLTEWLCEAIRLEPGMRVLDLGCGTAMSSIFLAKEFGVEVWANDLWIAASDNWQRVRAAGLEKRIFPIHSESHALPYADAFFDAVISIDAFHYFGTDTRYLGYITKFLRPDGQIGIVCPGLTQDLEEAVPDHLRKMFAPEEMEAFWSFRAASWWSRFWSRSGLLCGVESATLDEGWRYWVDSFEAALKAKTGIFFSHLGAEAIVKERDIIEADHGEYMALVRAIGRRKSFGSE